MKDRFPRTPAEFLEHGRIVVLRCDRGHTTWIRPENLLQRLGPDFDLYDGYAELQDTFPCDVCGATEQQIAFTNPDVRHFERLSFEEALVSSLEMRAFADARDGAKARRLGLPWPPGTKTIGRIRRFGPRR